MSASTQDPKKMQERLDEVGEQIEQTRREIEANERDIGPREDRSLMGSTDEPDMSYEDDDGDADES